MLSHCSRVQLFATHGLQPSGSSVHGILQAWILEWTACPPPGDLPDPGIEPASLTSPTLAGGFFTTSAACEAQDSIWRPLNVKSKLPNTIPKHPRAAILKHSSMGFPGGTSGKEPACQCRRHKRCGFDPWVRKIPWRRAWQPTPVFLPGESHGQRSLTGYSTQGHRVGHNWRNLAHTPTSDLQLITLNYQGRFKFEYLTLAN